MTESQCPALGQFERSGVEVSFAQRLWLKASPNTRVQRTRSRSPLTRYLLGSVRGPELAAQGTLLIESWNGEMIPVSQERALMVLLGISQGRKTVAPSGWTKVSGAAVGVKGRRTRFGVESATLPNKRVQRTRLRSPLTRHPLGGSSAAEDLVA